MNSRIFTPNSYVIKTILHTLSWLTLCSKEADVNPSAESEVNRGEEEEKEVKTFIARVLILIFFFARNVCRNLYKMLV